HISKEEQRLRIQRRLDNKEKHWKFNLSDLEDRKLWDSFQEQYQAVIRATTTGYAPWYCVPSDSKSTRNIIIMKILTAHLRSLKLRYPNVDDTNWPTVVE
ncbi:MAG: polyphosphate kinase 2 family protein, partial [Neisseriaceae bacterium]|nr:polyphosphate kinase 2 family protein [Neisseriaceae bacterium]